MQKKAINLGKELVAQLSREERADVFSRWVVHYISEQLVLAEKATGAEKAAVDERCFNAILTLWSRRRSLPNGLQPFEDFEPILRALARLDPDEPRSMYHSFPLSQELGGEPSEVKKLMDVVISLDRTARVLIEFLLSVATAAAVKPETRSLLENAVGPAAASDLEAVQELVRRHDALEGDPQAEALRRKKERLEDLDKFCSLCKGLADAFRAEPVGVDGMGLNDENADS